MKVLREVLSWLAHIVGAVVIALLIVVFAVQPTQVEGESMETNFHEGDRLLINKLAHTFRSQPDYGDIVIIDSRVDRPHTIKDDISDSLRYNMITSMFFKKSENDEIYWIKRVIGKAGDELTFENNKVVRNGVILEEKYIKEEMVNLIHEKVVVPEGHIFVMGDNRNESKDSRHIGCIPVGHVVGKLLIKF